MEKWIEDVYYCLINGGRCDGGEGLALIAEIERLEKLVADYLKGRTRNMKLLFDKQKKIESLDEENKRLVEVVDDWMSRYIKLEKKIEELQAMREAAEELQKLYKELLQILEDDGNTLADIYYLADKKLEQALAAKGKDEKVS